VGKSLISVLFWGVAIGKEISDNEICRYII
jgi:hypothetical protein